MAASKEQLSSKAQELTERVRESRFGKDVLGPKVAQPLAQWLDTNFGQDGSVDGPDHDGGVIAGLGESENGHMQASPTQRAAADRDPQTTASEDFDATHAAAALSAPDPSADSTAVEPELDITPDSPTAALGLLKALGARIKEHNLVVVAAGIAFWGLLAIPAILIASISIAGLVVNPDTVKDQVSENLTNLPPEAQEIIGEQLESVSGGSAGGLITGVVVGILLALWTASGAMAKLMATLNTIYGTSETRKFPKLRGTALGLTFGGIVFISSAVFLLAALPPILGAIDGVGGSLATLVNWLRFPVLGLVMVIALGVLYHVGPDRDTRYRPLTAGAAFAMLLWLALSGLFTIYTATFASYNETYGSIGGLVILLLWLFITAFVVLLGAEIHAEREGRAQAENQTKATA